MPVYEQVCTLYLHRKSLKLQTPKLEAVAKFGKGNGDRGEGRRGVFLLFLHSSEMFEFVFYH